MSQQWEYRAVTLGSNDEDVNAELAKWASQGWELVNGSYGGGGGEVTSFDAVWLFWRRRAR
jgi:hypothetical protein